MVIVKRKKETVWVKKVTQNLRFCLVTRITSVKWILTLGVFYHRILSGITRLDIRSQQHYDLVMLCSGKLWSVNAWGILTFSEGSLMVLELSWKRKKVNIIIIIITSLFLSYIQHWYLEDKVLTHLRCLNSKHRKLCTIYGC